MTNMTTTPLGIAIAFTPARTLVVHPLTRRLIHQHRDTFRKIELRQFDTVIDTFDAQAMVILDCLRLNYPDLAEDEFDDLLNSQNMPLAWLAVNSDFQTLDAAKKAMAVLQSGNLTGPETPPILPT